MFSQAEIPAPALGTAARLVAVRHHGRLAAVAGCFAGATAAVDESPVAGRVVGSALHGAGGIPATVQGGISASVLFLAGDRTGIASRAVEDAIVAGVEAVTNYVARLARWAIVGLPVTGLGAGAINGMHAGVGHLAGADGRFLRRRLFRADTYHGYEDAQEDRHEESRGRLPVHSFAPFSVVKTTVEIDATAAPTQRLDKVVMIERFWPRQ